MSCIALPHSAVGWSAVVILGFPDNILTFCKSIQGGCQFEILSNYISQAIFWIELKLCWGPRGNTCRVKSDIFGQTANLDSNLVCLTFQILE